MVSNDQEEENWSYMQKQLSNSRRKQTNRNNTYVKINQNKKTTQANSNSNINKSNVKSVLSNKDSYRLNPKSKRPVQFDNNTPRNKSNKKPNMNVSNSPLNTPTPFRNNASAKSDHFSLGNINPLPNIKSPYTSARDPFEPFPNLESWGVKNQPYYDDPFTTFRNTNSPFLPVYNSIKNQKSTKPYIVVPKLYQVPSPIMTNLDNYTINPRLGYINAMPYNRANYTPPIEQKFKDNLESSNQKLKSDEYIRSATTLLNTVNTKAYQGEDLFSTKFLEDLEFKPTPKPRVERKKVVRIQTKDPVAEQYIEDIKREASAAIPTSQYEEPPSIPYNSYAIDIAENIYKKEIESLVRKLAENTVDEEVNAIFALQKPIYDNIYESTINEMITEIARDALNDHQKQIQFLQNHEIKKVAKERIVNNIMLDTMLDKMAQHGKVIAENDDVGKLLDGIVLDILLGTNNDVRKVKDKTLKNYPLKKFHLNSFMNVALDVLVGELSSSLEEDMKDLDEHEKKDKRFY